MTAVDITIVNRRLDPAESELWVSAPEPLSGRFMGPRCKFANTVEIAHYLRPLPAGLSGREPTQRVVVPEPSFWEPETPFLYTGLLQGSSGTIRVRHGMRTISVGPTGLRVNRKPIRVHGVRRKTLADAAELRQASVNALLVPVAAESADIWEQADEWGFFVLGLVTNGSALSIAETLKGHASSLGWLVSESAAQERLERLQTVADKEPFLGLVVDELPKFLPSWAQFLAGPAARLSAAPTPWLALDGLGTTEQFCLGGIEPER